MVLLLIPLGVLSLFGIRYLNQKQNSNKLDHVYAVFLFITTLGCEISLVYSLLDLFGKTQGAVAFYSLLIPTCIYLIVIHKFTSKIKKRAIN